MLKFSFIVAISKEIVFQINFFYIDNHHFSNMGCKKFQKRSANKKFVDEQRCESLIRED